MDYYKKYYLSNEEIEEILRSGIIVMDASALLDLYYYSHASQEHIFDTVFEYLNSRLWIPAQVYFEYLKNKEIVAKKPIQSYESLLRKPKSGADGGHVERIAELSQAFSKDMNQLKNQLKTLKEKTIHEEKYPNIPKEEYEQLDSAIDTFESQIISFSEQVTLFEKKMQRIVEDKKSEIANEIENDKVLMAIQRKFVIGKEYSYKQQYEISQEGAFRYEEQIPPGYEDADEKIGMQKYGDLFAWKQILEYASKNKKSVVLVINDVKEDWYDEEQKAPRFELLKEFSSVCGQKFWSYTMKDFLYHLNKVAETDEIVSEQIIREAEEIEDDKSERYCAYYDFEEVLNNYFAGEVRILQEVPLSDEWRIFNKVKLYKGIDFEGRESIIMVNLIKGTNYTSALHPLRNIFEVKKYFDSNKKKYDYYQFTIASNLTTARDLYRRHYEKKNVLKLYQNESVKSFVGYVENDIFYCTETNLKRIEFVK